MPVYQDLRFLVVDDMLTMRKIVSKRLKGLGVTHIQEASDGAAAWDLLEKSAGTDLAPTFIISDWNMPQMGGVELLRKCRGHSAYKEVAFLLVTVETEAAHVKEAIIAGVDSYLVRPFTPASFQEKMNTVLRKRFR